MKTLLRGAIRGYQVIVSPVLHAMSGAGGGCRFHPTCSHYCMEALELHGTRSGLWLGIRRLLRCHPWGGQGMDPVPKILTDALKAGLSSPSGLEGGQRTRN